MHHFFGSWKSSSFSFSLLRSLISCLFSSTLSAPTVASVEEVTNNFFFVATAISPSNLWIIYVHKHSTSTNFCISSFNATFTKQYHLICNSAQLQSRLTTLLACLPSISLDSQARFFRPHLWDLPRTVSWGWFIHNLYVFLHKPVYLEYCVNGDGYESWSGDTATCSGYSTSCTSCLDQVRLLIECREQVQLNRATHLTYWYDNSD